MRHLMTSILGLLLLGLALSATAQQAQVNLAPLPQPDLSAFEKEVANQLAEARAIFPETFVASDFLSVDVVPGETPSSVAAAAGKATISAVRTNRPSDLCVNALMVSSPFLELRVSMINVMRASARRIALTRLSPIGERNAHCPSGPR